ncbi:hypothetical protein [Rhabdochlamydiaceae symbiont of Dictyostelium giganteum]|uniref:hypothetical protein n=1 Tax=Rhabdochlamydiaceae symbiont of Dictyostelium giganteum TaxID=3342349 RepID=UPI00384E7339
MTQALTLKALPSKAHIEFKENNIITIHDKTYRITHVRFKSEDGKWKNINNLSFSERQELTQNISHAFQALKSLSHYPTDLAHSPRLHLKFTQMIDPKSSLINRWVKKQQIFKPVEMSYISSKTDKKTTFSLKMNTPVEELLISQALAPLSLQLKTLLHQHKPS